MLDACQPIVERLDKFVEESVMRREGYKRVRKKGEREKNLSDWPMKSLRHSESGISL